MRGVAYALMAFGVLMIGALTPASADCYGNCNGYQETGYRGEPSYYSESRYDEGPRYHTVYYERGPEIQTGYYERPAYRSAYVADYDGDGYADAAYVSGYRGGYGYGYRGGYGYGGYRGYGYRGYGGGYVAGCGAYGCGVAGCGAYGCGYGYRGYGGGYGYRGYGYGGYYGGYGYGTVRVGGGWSQTAAALGYGYGGWRRRLRRGLHSLRLDLGPRVKLLKRQRAPCMTRRA